MMHIARDLSGGEKQRVVLARQLAKDPFLLFADEPTGTLDPDTATIVHSMLREAAQENSMGMVVTSHFPTVIEDLADRALLLADGELEMDGDSGEVISHFMADYLDIEEFTPPPPGEKILTARDVVKRYMSPDRGVVRAVNGVAFDVAQGARSSASSGRAVQGRRPSRGSSRGSSSRRAVR